MKKLLLLGTLFVGMLTSFGQDIEAKIDTSRIRIGEPARLTYKVDYKKGDKIQFQTLKDTLSHHIEIIDQKFDTVMEGEQNKIIHQLDLTSFDEGEFLIRTIPVIINGQTFKTPSFQINVEDVKVDTAQAKVHPIKPVMTEEYTLKDYWNKYWIIGIAALIAFIIAIVLIVLYIRSKSRNLKNKIPKTPYEEVIDGLKSIDAKKYLKRGEQKEFYTQLSFLLRRYIGKVYSVSALELLSDDLVQFITKKTDILEEDKIEFKKFLFDADLAKFAKQEFDDQKNQTYRKWVGEFVERIKPLNLPENDTATEDDVTGEKYKKWDNS
ncbi:MAG: hypothetical protein KBS93_08385 [Flavobacteriaceae bacterium]|nr:hypothetical protein [Candidatus Onthonaster equi]